MCLLTLLIPTITLADDFESIVSNNEDKAIENRIILTGLDIPVGYQITNISNTEMIGDYQCTSFSMSPSEGAKKKFIEDLANSLKKNIILTINKGTPSEKSFYNLVTDISYNAPTGVYALKGCSKISLMNLNTQSKLFINKPPAEILQSMLNEYQIDYEFDLKTKFEPKEFITRYNETDLNFFKRMLEEAGIFYITKFIDGKEKYIFVDDLATLDKHNKEFHYKDLNLSHPNTPNCCDAIDTLSLQSRMMAENYYLSDYDLFENKMVSATSNDKTGKIIQREYQISDYDSQSMKRIAETKLAALNSQTNMISISVNNPTISIGDKINIGSRKYYIIGSDIRFSCSTYSYTYNQDSCETYNDLSLVPEKTKFANAIISPFPTASMLVGLVTDAVADKKGRIGFRYPWMNQESDGMYRALPTEGVKNLGLKNGDRVIINFINGLIDRPIIMGKI
jgi:type VI secretion system secreted protein VgrG